MAFGPVAAPVLYFRLQRNRTNPLFDAKSITDTLVMQVTPNTFGFGANTPDVNADFVFFSGSPVLGSVRAYELTDSPTGSNSVTVGLFGYVDDLQLVGIQPILRAAGSSIQVSTLLRAARRRFPAALPLFATGLGALGLLGDAENERTAALPSINITAEQISERPPRGGLSFSAWPRECPLLAQSRHRRVRCTCPLSG